MGLFRRAADGIPELVPIPPIADLPPAKLQASGRYLGTLDAEGARVIGHSLSAKSAARLSLSSEALDVVRIAGSFRIRTDALRGARSGDHFAGKPVADLLVVRWEHHGRAWETGFRLDAAKSVRDVAKAQLGRSRGVATPEVTAWVRSISKLARGNPGTNTDKDNA
jgi:hypothetical protein